MLPKTCADWSSAGSEAARCTENRVPRCLHAPPDKTAARHGGVVARGRALSDRRRGLLVVKGINLTTLLWTDGRGRDQRADLGDPDLPFYLVQLGYFERTPSAADVAGWNAAREAQRVPMPPTEEAHLHHRR